MVLQISVGQSVSLSGAVVVTTPQELAVVDVLKGLRMFEVMKVRRRHSSSSPAQAHSLPFRIMHASETDSRRDLTWVSQVPTLAVVENMAYFLCGKCDEKHRIFGKGEA